MSPMAFLGAFGDALDFIVRERTTLGGGQAGGLAYFADLLGRHLAVSAAAMALAIAIALPLGAWLGHTGRGSFLAVTISNVGRAVPSIALLFVFFAWLGAGFLNVTLALCLLAVPPILTNAYVGFRSVDPEIVDAARGQGLTGLQVARDVELPLAAPLVFGGIRTSAVNVVATATIAPLAGVVTLGDPIINPNIVGQEGQIGAAIVVALVAVATEVGFALLQRAVTPRGLRASRPGLLRRARILLPEREATSA